MATKPATADRNSLNGAVIHTWEALGSADDGAPISVAYSANMTVQVVGTFDGATCVLEGSNDGSTWATLKAKHTGAGGSASVSFTSAGMASALEQPVFIRPKTSGGGAGSDLDVILVVKAEYAKVAY